MSATTLADVSTDRRTFTSSRGRRLSFTRLGFGTAPLGNMGRVIDEVEAQQVIEAALASGVRYIDTAPLYGHGLSEARVGRALQGTPRNDVLLSTKVGRLLTPCQAGAEASGIYLGTPPFKVAFDYSSDGIRRSFEASLARLGVEHVDILYVHDLEPATHGSRESYDARWREFARSGWRALDDLRDAGVVAAIGMGVNDAAPCERMLAEFDPDLFLLAGRYTLLEQAPLHALLPQCEHRNVGVVVGGPYNSGVLARTGGWYNYAAAPPAVAAKVERLAAACDASGVSLKAAALQLPAAHPAVVSVIPGGQTTDEVSANARFMAEEIPGSFWESLKADGLLDAAAPTPTTRVAPAC